MSDKVATLNMDNSSLRRRIELVKLDLEKVHQEKDEMERLLELKKTAPRTINKDLQSLEADESPVHLQNQINMQRRENEEL